MSPSPSRATTRPDGAGSVIYNLAGIAVLVLLLAVGAAYMLDRAGRMTGDVAPSLADGDVIEQTIGGRELNIPRNWFRYGEQMQQGFATQVDLEIVPDIPGFGPLPVQVTLLPQTRARASSTLLDRVYVHRFAEGMAGGVPGLVGKPLSATEGYAGETVWYDPLSPSPFVAKCMAAVGAGQSQTCLRTVHLPGGLAAIFSFAETALPAWREFDAETARWLGQIGAIEGY